MAKTQQENKTPITSIAFYNLEAEQYILGCVFKDPKLATSLIADLQEEDFYSPAHKIIFGAIKSLTVSNKPFDFVMLTDQLDRMAQLPVVGGLDYITKVATCVLSAAHYQNYLDIILRESSKRKVARACSDIMGRLKSAEDKTMLLADAEEAIFKIGKDSKKGELTPVSDSVKAFMTRCDQLYKNEDIFRGLRTGFKQFDKITNGLQKGDLIVVAARPGCGKSSLALNIAEQAAKDGKVVAVFSLEMPLMQLVQRLMCGLASVSMSKISGSDKLIRSDITKLMNAASVMSTFKLYIDDSSLNTPASIMSKCRALNLREGLDLIVVDYIQLMTSDERTESRQQAVSDITRSLKILAKELDVPVIALSQMNRLFDREKDREPMLSDLRESGAIEQNADMVLFINKKAGEQENTEVMPVDLIVAKHRNGEVGKLPMNWVGQLVHFFDGMGRLPNVAQNNASQGQNAENQTDKTIGKDDKEQSQDTNAIGGDLSDEGQKTAFEQLPDEDLWQGMTENDVPEDELPVDELPTEDQEEVFKTEN